MTAPFALYNFTYADRDGMMRDDSGNGHHGSYWGVPTFGVPGVTGTGVFFNADPAVLDFAIIPSHPDFSIGTDGLTIEMALAPATMDFQGSPAPLCAGFPSANYISFLNKHGEVGQPNPEGEWWLRMYPETAVGGAGCTGRAGRVSAYVGNPGGGQGAGAYEQSARSPGAYFWVKAAFDPPGPGARVRLWVNGVLSPPSSGALYSTYGISPVAGAQPVRLGMSKMDSAPATRFIGAVDRLSFTRGVPA